MLSTLTVKNFTLVQQLEVDFDSGMTAITGETGAGKSLLLGALSMALGDRADTDRIRTGAAKAEIFASFDIRDISRARQWLNDCDFDGNSDECLLRRSLTREGRSKGYINGQPATMQQLRQLGEILIDIHSQHEHQSLLRKDTHRLLLDEFAGIGNLAGTVAKHYQQWATVKQQLDRLESQSEELSDRRDLLSFQAEELSQLGLEEGEVEQLERDQQLLANAENILRDSNSLLELCSQNEHFNLRDGLSQSLQLLRGMAQKPAALAEAEKLLNSALIEVEEACSEIQHHLDGFELDPQRLQQVEERLSAVFQLARKHRVDPNQLLAKQQEIASELASLSGGANDIEAIHRQLEELAGQYLEAAGKLSKARQKTAKKLSAAIDRQFDKLAMAGAKFVAELSPLPSGQFSGQGLESIEFLIATNPGEPPRPLAKIASGGELSRISLAIQVIAAQHSNIPTLVFDEVDVGIGGATADVVGRMLRELGGRGQVICVTHQPQVAACAHHQLLASKETFDTSAHSDIELLDSPRRVEEVARMLGGAQITDRTLDHAREMLELGTQN